MAARAWLSLYMFLIMVSRTTRVSAASGERSRSTVGPSISWCLKFGFWLGYGLWAWAGPGAGLRSSLESEAEENWFDERNLKGLKIGKLGFWENEVVEEDEEKPWGFRSEEVKVNLSLREIMAAISVRRKMNLAKGKIEKENVFLVFSIFFLPSSMFNKEKNCSKWVN